MRTYSVGDYDTLFMHRRWRELINSEDFTVGLISKYEADEMEMRRRITTSPQEYYQKPVLEDLSFVKVNRPDDIEIHKSLQMISMFFNQTSEDDYK